LTQKPPSRAAAIVGSGNLLTIALEDYFHVGAFNRLVQRGEWYRFESRIEHGVRRTLELLDAHGAKASFFALGWVADSMPELLREIADRGHEVASKGYYHRDITLMTPEEFVDDLDRARDSIQRATGRRVMGYRVAGEWLRPEDMWVLDVLAGEGYAYDSSVAPRGFAFGRTPARRDAHQRSTTAGSIWEFPISSARVFGLLLPMGGNYFRQLPPVIFREAATRMIQEGTAPFTLYFHTWELDPGQPTITAAPFTQRLRHYRNLDRMAARVEWFLERWRFTSVASFLGIELAALPAPLRAAPLPVTMRRPTASEGEAVRPEARTPVTIVVPCHNEEMILPYLSNTLESVEARLGDRYRVRFIFVDDGSTDGTHAELGRIFGGKGNCRVLRIANNAGVAAAILHGIAHAADDVVCSIDCDCTYDPHELERMIPLLTEDVSMVTASPYHPEGHVRNVPGWRLMLSRTVSVMYRRVMQNKLSTYTSCFRVYRRSALGDIRLTRKGFLGITEMLGRLDLAGHRVVEHPTTLEVRMLGRSKLRVVRAIGAHLTLLAKLAVLRLGARSAPTQRTASQEARSAVGRPIG